MGRRFDHAWVDSARAPLFLWRVPNGPSIAEVEAFCSAMERFLAASNERFGWVTDLSELHSVGAVQRRVFVEANHRTAARLKQQIVAMAVYAPRPFQRSLVTLFHWFVPTQYPLRVFGDLQEAEAWTSDQLSMRSPPEIEAH